MGQAIAETSPEASSHPTQRRQTEPGWALWTEPHTVVCPTTYPHNSSKEGFEYPQEGRLHSLSAVSQKFFFPLFNSILQFLTFPFFDMLSQSHQTWGLQVIPTLDLAILVAQSVSQIREVSQSMAKILYILYTKVSFLCKAGVSLCFPILHLF